MDIESAGFQSSAVVKPLLLEALGRSLIAYLLDATEGEIEQWLASESDTFGSEKQIHALEQLMAVLQNIPLSGEPWARRLDLARILGLYYEPFSTTIANAVRDIATGQAPSPPPATGAPLETLLEKLIRDAYPLYLLPETSDPFPTTSTSLYSHPVRSRFDAAVTADAQLSRIFSEEGEHTGVYGHILRSTGQGGSLQISMFAETLVSSGWKMAEISTSNLPTVDEHVEATLTQLNIVRSALESKRVEVPVRIGLTGVLLHSTQPLNLGWGILRRADERDQRVAPKSLEGQVGGTRSDGTSVTVNYSGDVVLEATIEYRVLLQEFDLESEWPEKLRANERIGRLVESVQLGALLSEEYNTTEPIMVLPTWYYIHDPLSSGYNMSWSDPRLARAFMPKQLSEAEETEWCRFASAVEEHRTKYIDVAIRRTLRASSERKDFSDVLVDTVIAWENLAGSQQGEPTLRVSSSLARLLEGEFLKRKKLRTELAGIYSTRSDTVHGNKQPPARELIEKSHRALEITIKTLRLLFTDRLDLLKECKGGDERSIRILMED